MPSNGHRITINASQDQVYQAITTEEGLEGWYTPDVQGRPQKGGEITLSFSEKEGPFKWKVTEADPGRFVRWECVEGPGNAAGTAAIFRLSEKAAGQTHVDFDHEGLSESHEKLRTCNTLWGVLMLHLKNYVESQTPEPAFA